jgi:hypothetical protein
MTVEELDRLKQGERILQKINKIKEILAEFDKTGVRMILIPPNGKVKGLIKGELNLELLTGKEFVDDRVKGDLSLSLREMLVSLEEEFKKL